MPNYELDLTQPDFEGFLAESGWSKTFVRDDGLAVTYEKDGAL
jgi:hypothetical protein